MIKEPQFPYRVESEYHFGTFIDRACKRIANVTLDNRQLTGDKADAGTYFGRCFSVSYSEGLFAVVQRPEAL